MISRNNETFLEYFHEVFDITDEAIKTNVDSGPKTTNKRMFIRPYDSPDISLICLIIAIHIPHDKSPHSFIPIINPFYFLLLHKCFISVPRK